MARIGITYQDVASAASTVQGHDKIPTVDRIRAVLGTGSKSTIARYLKEWKLKTEHIPGADDLPQELVGLIKGLWERLKNEADQKISLYEQEVDRDITEMSSALNLEQKNNATLQINLRNIEEQLHQQVKLTNSLQHTLEEEKRTIATLTERNNALAQKTAEQKSEIERLHQLLSHIQANLEHYQASMQKLREEQALSHEKQKTHYEQEVQTLKKSLSEEAGQNQILYREIDQLKTELKLIGQQLNSITEQKNLLQIKLQEKSISEATLQNQYDQLQKASRDYRVVNDQKSEIIISQERKIAILTDQIDQLNKSLSIAEDTIHALRDEKLFLAQEKSHLEGQFKQLQQIGNNHVV